MMKKRIRNYKKLNNTSLLFCCFIIITLILITSVVFGYINDQKYPVDSWSEKAKIIASDGAESDWFGISVDIYGNYTVIGARDDDSGQGSAYIFKKQGDTWIQDQKLIANDGEPGDWFGISVSIYGDLVFVGADADDNENGLNAGSVYVYKRNESSWVQQAKILASEGTANDYFGRSVDINGNDAIIGAYYDDDIAGSAYVFKLIDEQWVESSKLIASDRMPNDYFGISTSIFNDIAIIGAYRDDNLNGENAGSVYVFKWEESSWVQRDKLLASDGNSGDRFGISISVDTGNLIIGSYWDDGKKGSAYLFNNTLDDWVEEMKLVAYDGEINHYFGRSVSLDENNLIIGAWGDDDSSGSAYVFKKVGNIWEEQTKLKASDGSVNDRFAYQVAIHGTCMISGAYSDNNENGIDAGSAYLFEVESSNDQIDIDQSVFDRGFPIRHALDGDWAAAQSFIPTLNNLTSVEIYLRRFGTPEFNLTVELRTDDPQRTLIDTLTFTSEEIPSSWEWYPLDFTDTTVIPSMEYFIVCPPAPSGVTTSFGYEWGYAFGNQYGDGAFWFTRDGGGLWRELPTTYEFVFRTYGFN